MCIICCKITNFAKIFALFPQVRSLSLSSVSEVHGDTTAVSRYVAAIIGTTSDKPLPKAEVRKLREWLQARVKADSLIVIDKF